MYRVILGLVVSSVVSMIVAYPPNLPSNVIRLYDYPIVRLIALGSIFYGALIIPDFIIPIAIVYAILSDDIVKAFTRKSQDAESFMSQQYPLINLLPGASDVQVAQEYSRKQEEDSLSMLKNTVKQLELQIADLSRLKK